MKRIKSKKGFTLVETVIGIVVFMILAGTASGVMLTAFNLYGRSSMKNRAQNVGDTVYELIDKRLSYCYELVIGDNSESYANGMMCIKIGKDGKSVRMGNVESPSEFIDSDEFDGMKLTVTASIYDNTMVNISVTLIAEDDGRTLYSRDGYIKLFNSNDLEGASGTDSEEDYSSDDDDLYFIFKEIS